MKTILLNLVFVVLLGSIQSKASGLISPERATVGGIARAMQMYQIAHPGRLPTTWDEINEFYNLNEANKSLIYRQSYPIQDRYQFIMQPMLFKGHGGEWLAGSQVLMMRTVPLENLSEPNQDERRQWRYLIVRSKEGVIGASSLPEADIQVILKAAGVTITPKPGLATVETDEIIPSREPRPEPNPNDIEFLKKHPELDPSYVKTPIAEQPTIQQPTIPKSPPKNMQWWLILGIFIVLAGAWIIFFRRKP